MEQQLEEARETFNSGRTKSFEWRKAQLRSILILLQEKEEDAFRALSSDIGKHHVEAFRDEIGVLIKSVNLALDNLKKWMAPKTVHIPLVAFPTRGELVPEPLGVVLIFSSWNLPIGLSIEPLIGAIAAGNTIVLKPSELAPASASFLANVLPIYLDSKAVKVILGGPHVAKQLLEHKWDKIFFTGSKRVARDVMTAAAKYLTPVALELGGKCPAIFDSLLSSRDMKVAMQRIVAGKWGCCSGQACIGVDYLLVEEKFAPTVINSLRETIKRFFVGHDSATRIINKHHYIRLSNILNDPAVGATIVHGGTVDHEKLLIEPTILLDPPLDSEIMTDEIFGPLLPIITLKKIEDSIEFIRERPKPLVIYAFTNNEKFKNRILAETSSGSVTFNDTMIQYVCDALPFGGVGPSGSGQYHGKFSFNMFSHSKAVLRRSFLIEFNFRYPPWNPTKLQFLRFIYNFDYFGILGMLLGTKR